MTVNIITENEDIVKEIQLTTSPVEYLVLNDALRQFVKNRKNNLVDVGIAADMSKALTQRKEVENGNDS